MMNTKQKFLFKKITLSLTQIAVLVSAVVILLNIFRWDLIDMFFIFEILIELVVYGIFAVFFLWTMITRLFRSRDDKKKVRTSFLINVLTFVIICFVPFTDLTINLDFKLNKESRMEVIEMVEAGLLVPNVSYNSSLINLPEEYRGLSKGGGDIVISKDEEGTAIFFYTFRGILDNFSGFVYEQNDVNDVSEKFGCDPVNIIEMDPNWFWISCT